MQDQVVENEGLNSVLKAERDIYRNLRDNRTRFVILGCRAKWNFRTIRVFVQDAPLAVKEKVSCSHTSCTLQNISERQRDA